jgi:glyoxylase-like metal-dependent hydrolase (beta-lactamase superfamily II)
VVSSGFIRLPPTYLPAGADGDEGTETDDAGHVLFGFNWLLIRTDAATVVVDPSCWTAANDPAAGELVPGADPAAALRLLGVDPGEVTHVVVTHGHEDHFSGVVAGGQPRFPGAEHLFPAPDWAGLAAETLRPVEQAGLLRLVEGDHAVAGNVSLLHAPGETPGHQVVLVDGALCYIGDLVHVTGELRHPGWSPIPGRDEQRLLESRRRVLSEPRARDAAFLFTHGRFPAWGAVEPAGDGWSWRYD